MRKPKWDVETGKKMWFAGKTDEQIAEALGTTKQAVQLYRTRYWGTKGALPDGRNSNLSEWPGGVTRPLPVAGAGRGTSSRDRCATQPLCGKESIEDPNRSMGDEGAPTPRRTAGNPNRGANNAPKRNGKKKKEPVAVPEIATAVSELPRNDNADGGTVPGIATPAVQARNDKKDVAVEGCTDKRRGEGKNGNENGADDRKYQLISRINRSLGLIEGITAGFGSRIAQLTTDAVADVDAAVQELMGGTYGKQ